MPDVPALLRTLFEPRYEVLREIGRGARATVYLALDRQLQRRVALKILRADPLSDVEEQRFLREIRLLATLQHPNILPLHDAGLVGEWRYYVMPHVEGESLRDRLRREGCMEVGETLRLGSEIADALQCAHAAGIVHRDIKPENILLSGSHPLIADFGIARLLVSSDGQDLTRASGGSPGTPAYMSPEQLAGEPVDGRSDMYSLGCVMHEMLCGAPPFTGAAGYAARLVEDAPLASATNSDVPAEVDAVLQRMLARSPDERYMSAGHLAVELVRLWGGGASGRRMVGSSASAAPRLWRTLSRNVRKEIAGWRRARERRQRHSRFGGSAWALAIAAAILAAAVIGLNHSSPGGASPSRQRIVVSVFENRTGDSDHRSLAFMAADWVTAGLQKTGVVDVVPSETVLALWARHADSIAEGNWLSKLAEETGAQLVVSGAVYAGNDSLFVQAQVVDIVADRLVGALEPIVIPEKSAVSALQPLRSGLMGLLALSHDERIVEAVPTPTFESYHAFSLGMDAYVRTDYVSAIPAFERAFREDSTFVLPLLYASLSYSNVGDFATADSLSRVVERRRSTLPAFHRHWLDYRLAELAGDRREALAAIQRAARLAPTSKATYNLAVAALEGREPALAESALKSVSPDLGPMRGWIHYWEILTSALHAQGKHREEISAARQARRRFGDRVESYVFEGRALAAERRTTELERLYKAATQLPSSTPRDIAVLGLEVGSELAAHGDSIRARMWFARAYDALAETVGSAPSDAHWLLAQAAYRLGRSAEALDYGQRLLKTDSTQARYLGSVATAAVLHGDTALARSIQQRLTSDQRPYQFGRPQFEAARIAIALQDLPIAITLLRTALARGFGYHQRVHQDPVLGRIREERVYRTLTATSTQ